MYNASSEGWEQLKSAIEKNKVQKQKLAGSIKISEQLYYQLVYEPPKTKDGWIELYKAVQLFLSEKNPEEEKALLLQYTEMLAMIVKGYESMKE